MRWKDDVVAMRRAEAEEVRLSVDKCSAVERMLRVESSEPRVKLADRV